MRVIKDNTLQYEVFHESLPNLVKSPNSSDHLHLVQPHSNGSQSKNKVSEENFLDLVFSFGKDVANIKEFSVLMKMYNHVIGKLLDFEEANIFIYDESQLKLQPIEKDFNGKSKYFINKAMEDGVLDWVFETGKLSTIPDYQTFNAKGAKLFYLMVPIIRLGKSKGVFTILTKDSTLSEKDSRYRVIHHCLNMVFEKYESIRAFSQLNSTYNELQVYQSKLSNDYKLSAIGELTTGLAEDILSPLQIISSYTEFLRKEDGEGNSKIFNSINNQISKIEIVVKRLIKFASINPTRYKIQPCNLNKLIQEYYDVILSALKNDKYECILELDEDVPSVLSHPDHINQILTNIFTLVKSNQGKGGGILIQTKFVKENIVLKILGTDYIEDFKNNTKDNIENLNMRILTNLMKKHEGSLKIKSNQTSGTLIELYFPLKRKIRQ